MDNVFLTHFYLLRKVLGNFFFKFFLEYCLGSTLYIGDGFCDDDNNNELCGYDGNDCCLENVKMNYCTICQCIGKDKLKLF